MWPNRQDITEILLKVALSTIKLNLILDISFAGNSHDLICKNIQGTFVAEINLILVHVLNNKNKYILTKRKSFCWKLIVSLV